MKKLIRTSLSVLILILLSISMSLHAEVRLPRIIGSNMVLQRNQPVKIWGWADKGEKVTVSIQDQELTAKTGKDGRWSLTLEPMQAGGPYRMVISGKNIIELDNILVGDVWVCSGQSNMELSVASSNNAREEILTANYPMIRLFDVPHNLQLAPVDDIPSGEWVSCSPATIGNFTAAGYFFGRYIHNELDVPIGLISTNWGGTNVETWTSREMAVTDPEMKKALEGIDGVDTGQLLEKMEQERRTLLASLGKRGWKTGMGEGRDRSVGMENHGCSWSLGNPGIKRGGWCGLVQAHLHTLRRTGQRRCSPVPWRHRRQ
jgi:sialate O-acetylesterase